MLWENLPDRAVPAIRMSQRIENGKQALHQSSFFAAADAGPPVCHELKPTQTTLRAEITSEVLERRQEAKVYCNEQAANLCWRCSTEVGAHSTVRLGADMPGRFAIGPLPVCDRQ